MHYSSIDFSQTPVEQVMREAAEELYLATHKVRAKAGLKVQNLPAGARGERFEAEVAEATWDDLLLCRDAFDALSACGRQLWTSASWARARDGVPQWSREGRDACIAMRAIQEAYSVVQDAAMLFPGSEGQKRKEYWSLLADPSNPVEQQMVDALSVLKRPP